MRNRWGLVVIIAIGFVFLLGSSLALVELGTSQTTCRATRFGSRLTPLCTTTGGTSPVVYVILVVAIVIGVICLAAGITVLAVRISGPPVGGALVVPTMPSGGAGFPAGGGFAAGSAVTAQGEGATGATGGSFGAHAAGGGSDAGTGASTGGAGSSTGTAAPGWYEVTPGGPKRYWDGTRWTTATPPAE